MIMDIQIRLSKSEDLEKILELQTNSIITLSSGYNLEQIESLVRGQAAERLKCNEIMLVADYADRLVGFISLLTHKPQIGGVFVDPDFTQRGIGSKMLEAIERIAVDRKHELVHVISAITAVGFYQARGYQVIRQSGFLSEGTIWIPCVILEKRLFTPTRIERWIKRITYFIPLLRRITVLGFRVITIILIIFLLPIGISQILSLLLK